MSQIAKSLTELIGNTPLLELGKFSKEQGLETPITVKVEFFNPGGSVKDRIALAMIEDAEKKGILKTGGNHHRAYIRKHRRRTGFCQCRQGIPSHPDNA